MQYALNLSLFKRACTCQSGWSAHCSTVRVIWIRITLYSTQNVFLSSAKAQGIDVNTARMSHSCHISFVYNLERRNVSNVYRAAIAEGLTSAKKVHSVFENIKAVSSLKSLEMARHFHRVIRHVCSRSNPNKQCALCRKPEIRVTDVPQNQFPEMRDEECNISVCLFSTGVSEKSRWSAPYVSKTVLMCTK